ncbi:TPA: hypothetical protein HH296_02930 [Xanthomonas vasicola pv. zeae]|uniref:hypothetical protein n=1 Tax=Xanthomonas vasicola TaxID=56459 RepID=UPI0012FE2BEF|nr:hypothetical protein [Xanthomonas vasicola]MBV7304362.1 hypothetical protein [Xanthomonas vasicola pv. vasculorum]MDO6934322.1 hypothetical protein [Xanthomonas vasicola]MDO6938100.1 hypothetical protein [Xanthomonas vasicola]HHZ21493.1 hypothetical protein [Xanthomonas vasicola pv. zeae]HHZ25265.1 hypothetical protein [Xanthomonas vasicola pv. zeae]
MPVYAGIGVQSKYLGKIQRNDGSAKHVTAWVLTAQLCCKQAQEANVLDSPAGQVPAAPIISCVAIRHLTHGFALTTALLECASTRVAIRVARFHDGSQRTQAGDYSPACLLFKA